MEDFRKKVQTRLGISSMLCMSGLAIYFALTFLTKNADEFAKGLSMGVFCGLEIVAVFNTIRLLFALKNEEKLREMYIRENDERIRAIERMTAQKGFIISIIGMALGAIVAGFFDVRVCLALVGALLFSSVVTLCARAYYNKNM